MGRKLVPNHEEAPDSCTSDGPIDFVTNLVLEDTQQRHTRSSPTTRTEASNQRSAKLLILFQMKLQFQLTAVTTNLVLLLAIFGPVNSDLTSDSRALLEFASTVPHVRKLNWNQTNSICTSWIGITCTKDKTRVVEIHLPGIGLYGPIPGNTIGRLTALRVFSLRSNYLNGTFPSDILSIPSLQSIFLQNNNFSGDINPVSLSSRLSIIDLSFNSFSGEIPFTFKNLKRLSYNSFSGVIPDIDLPTLKIFNLSHNLLNGSIPNSLQKFPVSAFEETIVYAKKNNGETTTVIIAKAANVGKTENLKSDDFGSGVQGAEKNKLVFFEGCSFSFDLEDLLRASAEVLGKGSYGTAYKAILDEATTVVVKRLKDVGIGKKEFEQQMEIVNKLGRHPNVVPLLAYYFSKDEKLLVYEYMPAGSLSSALHGNRGTGRTALDWDSRLNISLGAARGLAHIHSENGAKYTHGNIKSSNILLNSNLDGCVSDFGLSPMMSFLPIKYRVPGYRAPEVIETRKVNQKSDVYSFGVVLLEMLTGKSPIQYSGYNDDVVDLPRWVRSVVREEWTAEVFDAELTKGQNIEEEMVQMLQIALACVAKVADMRPSMDDVVRMIEDVRCSESGDRPSSEDNRSKDSNVATPTP
ncbi:hypothetical protein DH2020_044309 [Rehmannia glutinosa]|uniref:Protein kinase domain-containing protein n=1 Tax=Rehmannia glutinosa TaxID=99300 RepID=A0ABR0UH99_REHGL